MQIKVFAEMTPIAYEIKYGAVTKYSKFSTDSYSATKS